MVMESQDSTQHESGALQQATGQVAGLRSPCRHKEGQHSGQQEPVNLPSMFGVKHAETPMPPRTAGETSNNMSSEQEPKQNRTQKKRQSDPLDVAPILTEQNEAEVGLRFRKWPKGDPT